jgi:hypothetical protein
MKTKIIIGVLIALLAISFYYNYQQDKLINKLIKENIELSDSLSVADFNPILEHSEIRPR